MHKTVVRRSAREALEDINHLHPVLRQVYARRDLDSTQELASSLEKLLPYDDLSGIGQAVDLLMRALEHQQRILVVADFDADGATSCAVAIRALRMLGAQQVDYLVPNRFEFGYGLTPEIVDVAVTRRPDLIITVDNGIASASGVRRAHEFGISVLITDHHLPPDELPEADAIVNPNLHGDPFASKHLAGVGVIFYVMLALRAALRRQGRFRSSPEPNLACLLDLVALGTVADVVKLDHNNRILVAQGLSRIRRGKASAGIAALIAVSGRNPSRLAAADLGFALGPRLNAAGRLEDMSLGIACLLSDSLDDALPLAGRLDELNHERRQIEADMKQQALTQLALDDFAGEIATLPYGLCIYHENWHQGVIGILAARLKERVHRPVIAFAPAGEGELKGSARSVPGLHIRDALDSVARRHPGLLNKFGGHAMAAGLSLPLAHYEEFSRAFDREVRVHLDADDLRGVIYSDGELPADDFAIEVAELLRFAGPWGQGFPEPVFDGHFIVRSLRIVGEVHLKLQLQPARSAAAVDAILFHGANGKLPAEGDTVHVAFRLDVNEYLGRRQLQLVVEHMAPVGR